MTLIHIGANKAMSTTIQKHIFKKDNSSLYLGVNSEDQLISAKELYKILNYDNHLYNVDKLSRVVEEVTLKLKEENKRLIFSCEDVLTSPILDRAAERLTTVFTDPEILLIIRNQQNALRSYYQSHGVFNRPSPKPYFKLHLSPEAWWQYNTSDLFRMSGPIPSFDYKLIIETFSKFVPREKIHVLVYEECVKNTCDFSKKLSDISRIKSRKIEKALNMVRENTALPYKRVFLNMITSKVLGFSSEYILQYDNGYAGALIELLLKIVPNFHNNTDFFESELYQKKLFDLYSQGNCWLDKEFNLQLGRYGYVGC